jgi:hypothetical protein
LSQVQANDLFWPVPATRAFTNLCESYGIPESVAF